MFYYSVTVMLMQTDLSLVQPPKVVRYLFVVYVLRGIKVNMQDGGGEQVYLSCPAQSISRRENKKKERRT